MRTLAGMSHLAGLGACALLFAQIGACFADAQSAEVGTISAKASQRIFFRRLRWRESHASEFAASARNKDTPAGIESGVVHSTFTATQVLADSSTLEENSRAWRSTNILRNRL